VISLFEGSRPLSPSADIARVEHATVMVRADADSRTYRQYGLGANCIVFQVGRSGSLRTIRREKPRLACFRERASQRTFPVARKKSKVG
jgi:hypothetical protein